MLLNGHYITGPLSNGGGNGGGSSSSSGTGSNSVLGRIFGSGNNERAVGWVIILCQRRYYNNNPLGS